MRKIWLASLVALCLSIDTSNEAAGENNSEQSSVVTTVVTKPLEQFVLRGLSERQRGVITDGFPEGSGNNPKEFSIRLDCKPRAIPAQQYTICLSRSDLKPSKWYFLTRPGDVHIVAVVRTSGANKITLNPKEFFVYDGIPHLEELTRNLANELWGVQRKNNESTGFVTYKLDSTREGKIEPFFLDIAFENDKLSGYRVRSCSLTNSTWNRISKLQEREEY